MLLLDRSDETKQPALLGPGDGERADPLQPKGGQIDWLPAVENGLGDIRGEIGKRQGLTHIPSVNTFLVCEIS